MGCGWNEVIEFGRRPVYKVTTTVYYVYWEKCVNRSMPTYCERNSRKCSIHWIIYLICYSYWKFCFGYQFFVITRISIYPTKYIVSKCGCLSLHARTLPTKQRMYMSFTDMFVYSYMLLLTGCLTHIIPMINVLIVAWNKPISINPIIKFLNFEILLTKKITKTKNYKNRHGKKQYLH